MVRLFGRGLFLRVKTPNFVVKSLAIRVIVHRRVHLRLSIKAKLHQLGTLANRDINVIDKTIDLNMADYLQNGGMSDYVTEKTELSYTKGDCEIIYTPKGLKGTRKVLPALDLQTTIPLVLIEGASLDYTQTGVYMVENEIILTTAYKSRANFIADEASLLSSTRQAPKRQAAYCMFYLLAFFHDYVFGKTRTCF